MKFKAGFVEGEYYDAKALQRAIGDDEPKYLNSPETSVFSKKYNLYGMMIAFNNFLRPIIASWLDIQDFILL